MADKTRIPLPEARTLAAEVVGLLRDVTERIEVAGSIRRGKADIGDIEIVCTPRYENRAEQVDMFSARTVHTDLLHARCAELRAAGTFEDRPDKNGRPAFGDRYKRLLYRDFALDVFSVLPPAQWGVLLCLRTGPAEFNQALVLKRSQGGWLPRGLFFRDGQLWKLPPPYDADLVEHAEPIPTPEEADVFRAMGFAFVAPEQRSEQRPAALVTA